MDIGTERYCSVYIDGNSKELCFDLSPSNLERINSDLD